MRLYLSSYQLGYSSDRFVWMTGQGSTGVVIMNALDAGDPERRARDTLTQIANLVGIGFNASELDLRDHTPETIGTALGGIDFVWVRGGNVFVLREAMARSGFDAELVRALGEDRFSYGGFSAGACVLAPSLRGLELCDPVEDAERLYGHVTWEGLGILDRPVVPHLDSPGHPETDLLGQVARNYEAAGQEYYGLRDGEALVMDEGYLDLL